MFTLLIPDHDPNDPKPYPADIQPREYSINEVVELMRQHADDPKIIRFIADMLEE